MLNQENSNKIRTRPNPTCYLCGMPGNLLYEGLKDRLFGSPGEWNLKKCSNKKCELIWLDPMPIEEDIGKAYEVYYTHGSDSQGQTNSISLYKRLVRAVFHRVIYRLLRIQAQRAQISSMYLSRVKPGKLLEVGCGSGKFLSRMQSFGWYVEGIDFDPKAVEQARQECGAKVEVGSLESIRYKSDSFDAVAMNHVIEHVHDPISLFHECHRILKSGGYLVAITPNVNSWGHQKFKQNWRDLDPPRHLYLFSQKTLARCASEAGFSEIKNWSTSANAEVFFWGSFDIEKTGIHIMSQHNSIYPIKSALFQSYAILKNIIQPSSGEEVCLIARKP